MTTNPLPGPQIDSGPLSPPPEGDEVGEGVGERTDAPTGLQYEYRVMYEHRGMSPPRVWVKANSLEMARKRAELAIAEGRWGWVWIERRPILDWERVVSYPVMHNGERS